MKPLFAFWENDSFPYMLGSKIIDFEENGRVRVEGYPGFLFNPIKIITEAEGKDILSKLKKLESDYSEAKKRLLEDYIKEAKNIAPLLGEYYDSKKS